MSENEVIEGDGVSEAMLRGRDDEDQKAWFERFQSAERNLTLGDIEIPEQTAQSSGSGGNRVAVVGLALVAAALALAGAFPGPAAGILPLAMDVIATAGPVSAAVIALLAGILALNSTSTPAPQSGSGFARRRPIFAGSGPMRIGLGDVGLQLNHPRRFLRAHWPAFDAATLMAKDLNGEGLPMISQNQAQGVTLETLFQAGNPAVDALIEACSVWASQNSQLRLPFKVDRSFAVRKTKSGSEPIVPLGLQREFIVIDKRFFEAANEGDGLSWARAVACCVFMIQLKDPQWVDEISAGTGSQED